MLSFLKNIMAYWRQENIKKILKILFGVAIVLFMLIDGRKFIAELNYREIMRLLKQLSPMNIFIFFTSACAAVLLTSLYDIVAIFRNGNRIPIGKIAKTAWIANTFNNVAGFGGLGGAAIRLILYKNVMEEKAIHKINLQIVPATITGLGVLMIVNLLGVTEIQPMLTQYKWLPLLMFGFISFIPVFCWFTDIKLSRTKFEFSHLPNRHESMTRVTLVAVSAFDWMQAVAVLWLVVRYFDPTVSIWPIVGLFSVATSAGIASMIPGGVGSFDLMLIFGLKLIGLETNEAMAALLLFRFFYYIIPLIIGAFLATGELANLHSVVKIRAWFSGLFKKPSIQTTIQVNDPDEANSFAIQSMYLLTQLAAAMLVISSAVPDFLDRTRFMEFVVTLPVMQNAHRVALVSGLLLALIVQELPLLTKRSRNAILLLLTIGSGLSIVKGFNLEVGLFLLAVALLLLRLKDNFTREMATRRYASIFKAVGISMLLTGLYIFFGTLSAMSHVDAPKGFDILRFTTTEILINGLGALVVAWSLYSIWLFKLERPIIQEDSEAEKYQLMTHLENFDRSEHTHLYFMKDKLHYWGASGSVLLSYAMGSRHTFVLGEPIGEALNFAQAMAEFKKEAILTGYPPVYYQVDESFMKSISERDYMAYAIADLGLVSLDEEQMDQVVKKLLKTHESQGAVGLSFKIHQPPHDVMLMATFSKLHSQWLKGHIEKFLAVGWFDKATLMRQNIASIYNGEGEMIAFAALHSRGSHKDILATDWMRFDDESLKVAELDYLYASVLQYAKNNGYKYFDLGLAPLSEEMGKDIHQYHRVANMILYNDPIQRVVKDIRQYKSQFNPVWHARYLLCPIQDRLPDVLIEISMLGTVGHGLTIHSRSLKEMSK